MPMVNGQIKNKRHSTELRSKVSQGLLWSLTSSFQVANKPYMKRTFEFKKLRIYITTNEW